MNDLPAMLRDIHQPPADFWWPPAPGWWLLGLLLLAVMIAFLWFLWRRTALRRAALAELERIRRRHAEAMDRQKLAMAVEILLRRVAIARQSREAVAGKTGAAWLAMLDELGKTREFSDGVGQVLTTAPYNNGSRFDDTKLLKLAEAWIRKAA